LTTCTCPMVHCCCCGCCGCTTSDLTHYGHFSSPPARFSNQLPQDRLVQPSCCQSVGYYRWCWNSYVSLSLSLSVCVCVCCMLPCLTIVIVFYCVETLAQLDASALQYFAPDSARTAAMRQDYDTSRSSIASVMTMMTGEMPTTHGVFGRTWIAPGATDEAVAFASTQTNAPTIADMLLKTLPVCVELSLSLSLSPSVSYQQQLLSWLVKLITLFTHDVRT
jgi:hypothetical protein